MQDICQNHHGNNPESTLAYSTGRKNYASIRLRVFEAIEQLGDATTDELEQYLVIPNQTLSARVSELKKMGRIVPTGERRLTRLGRPAAVYKANMEHREWQTNYLRREGDPEKVLTRILRNRRKRAQRPAPVQSPSV